MKIILPEVLLERVLLYPEGKETKSRKKYCCNCKNYFRGLSSDYCFLTAEDYYSKCSNSFEESPKVKNKKNDCKDYKKEWYKFWIK